MNKYIQAIYKYISKFLMGRLKFAKYEEGKKDLEYFKNDTYIKLVTMFLVIGLIPLCYGSFLFFKENNIIAGILESMAYIAVLLSYVNSRIEIIIKRYVFVLSILLLGLMLLFAVGPAGAGLIVIFASFGLAACLLDKIQNIAFIYINLLIFIVISFFLEFGLLDDMGISQYAGTWYIVSLSTLCLGILFVLIINNAFDNIGKQIEEVEKQGKIIAESEQRYKFLFEYSGLGVGFYNLDGTVISFNKKAKEDMGDTDDYEGRSIYDLFPKEEADFYMGRILEASKTDKTKEYLDFVSLKSGDKWYSSTYKRISDPEGEIIGIQIISKDITEQKKSEELMIHLSYYDQLTGLYNRRFYEEELKRLDNDRNLPIALIMMDVNGLKLTNDAFGHQAGDALLKKVAELLKRECRSDEIISRIGGDEFVILIPKTDSEIAKKIIQRIETAVEKEYSNNGLLSLSVGFAIKNSNIKKFDEIFKEAEDDMYRHKLSESSSFRSKSIDIIMNSLYEKSSREMKHSKRVSYLCEQIASSCGLNQEEIKECRVAGLVHDIGKIGVSNYILDKDGRLTNEEWTEMKKHSEMGYRILSSVVEFSEIAKFVLYHQERWDGKGYPKGLKGDEIPIQSRIIAVADSFDAMTVERSYRKAMSDAEAIVEIKKYIGTQFDPMIARTFVEKVLGEAWE